MKCNVYRELISAWMDNEISSFEKQELQEHLDQCSDCRLVWKSYVVSSRTDKAFS